MNWMIRYGHVTMSIVNCLFLLESLPIYLTFACCLVAWLASQAVTKSLGKV